MTTTEFSQAFDTQIAAYNVTLPIGEADKKFAFDEYEKSLFLTRAQEDLILSYYSGKNTLKESFELTEEIRRYLAPIIDTAELTEILDESDEEESTEPVTPDEDEEEGNTEEEATEEEEEEVSILSEESTTSTPSVKKIHKNSHLFKLPDNLWFITYESILTAESSNICLNNISVDVQPVTHDELSRVLKNPFRGITRTRALRLDLGEDYVEIIYPNEVATYTIRYIKEPTPIILDTLSEEIDIKGKHDKCECILHSALHKAILDRAVQLAISSRAISNTQQ